MEGRWWSSQPHGNLTILAPAIVAAIVDETLPPEGTQFDLAVAAPPLW